MSTDPGKTHFVGDGCQPAHDPRIDQAPPEVWPHPTYIELERQVEQLQSALCVSEQQTADAEELWRADVKRLSEEVERLRVELAALNHISAGHLQACVIAEADAERLRTLIDKHNDECRECPVIELDSDKAN